MASGFQFQFGPPAAAPGWPDAPPPQPGFGPSSPGFNGLGHGELWQQAMGLSPPPMTWQGGQQPYPQLFNGGSPYAPMHSDMMRPPFGYSHLADASMFRQDNQYSIVNEIEMVVSNIEQQLAEAHYGGPASVESCQKSLLELQSQLYHLMEEAMADSRMMPVASPPPVTSRSRSYPRHIPVPVETTYSMPRRAEDALASSGLFQLCSSLKQRVEEIERAQQSLNSSVSAPAGGSSKAQRARSSQGSPRESDSQQQQLAREAAEAHWEVQVTLEAAENQQRQFAAQILEAKEKQTMMEREAAQARDTAAQLSNEALEAKAQCELQKAENQRLQAKLDARLVEAETVRKATEDVHEQETIQQRLVLQAALARQETRLVREAAQAEMEQLQKKLAHQSVFSEGESPLARETWRQELFDAAAASSQRQTQLASEAAEARLEAKKIREQAAANEANLIQQSSGLGLKNRSPFVQDPYNGIAPDLATFFQSSASSSSPTKIRAAQEQRQAWLASSETEISPLDAPVRQSLEPAATAAAAGGLRRSLSPAAAAAAAAAANEARRTLTPRSTLGDSTLRDVLTSRKSNVPQSGLQARFSRPQQNASLRPRASSRELSPGDVVARKSMHTPEQGGVPGLVAKLASGRSPSSQVYDLPRLLPDPLSADCHPSAAGHAGLKTFGEISLQIKQLERELAATKACRESSPSQARLNEHHCKSLEHQLATLRSLAAQKNGRVGSGLELARGILARENEVSSMSSDDS